VPSRSPSVRPTDPAAGEIKIGVSACILGEEVRWNGGHKLDAFVKETLGAFVRFVPVCPEAELGLGVPREPVHLVRLGKSIRLVGVKSGADHTDGMNELAARRVAGLAGEELCGFIVQKGSPSCGMERVKVHSPAPKAGGAMPAREVHSPAPKTGGAMPARDGRGLFTAELMRQLPHLPVEEDGRLHDPALRESFIERVFAYRRLRALFGRAWTVGDLVAFHAAEKMLVLAHDRPAYQRLGQLVAGAKRRAPATVAEDYQALMLDGLRRVATRGKHANVLQHLAGHFKNLCDEADRRELADVIESYRTGLIPLIVPITLLRHHVRRHSVTYLANQTYLEPNPRELMLRNHV
jgi:uncharacterized protein YbgA (DUF1722 family)/uncharacterized protein YbbK (DUF523 family)